MPINITLNAILILALGLVFMLAGMYFVMIPYTRIVALGMFALTLGCVCCGLTDGFTDISPRGLLLRKFGFVAFLVGIPIVGYSLFNYI